jgi:A/G-specific adenine glycosylase
MKMMSRNQSNLEFRKKLLRWYQHHHRKLPWRETTDPYKIWISEVMLQQTTIPAVIPYYKTWIQIFPDIESLASSPIRKVLKVWQGLGYYQRAKNLRKAARIIVKDCEGKIPLNYEDLRKLPGFGPYTTAAILSLAFDKPFPVVEANVRRVMMRLLLIRGEAHPKNDRLLLSCLQPLLPQKNIRFFNQALMELGALVCRAQNPLCLLCPVRAFCRAFKAGEQEVIPSPKKRSYKKIETVVGIIQKNKKYLIQKRPSNGLLADLWEFPGGKRKAGETLEDALHRELKEELGADVQETKFLIKVQHSYTQYQVSLYAYECSLKAEPKNSNNLWRWVTLRGLRHYPFPSGSAKIITFLEEKEKRIQTQTT